MAKNQHRGKPHGGKSSRSSHQRRKAKNHKGKPPHDKSTRTNTSKGIGGDVIEGRQAVRELLLAEKRKVREVTFLAGMDPSPVGLPSAKSMGVAAYPSVPAALTTNQNNIPQQANNALGSLLQIRYKIVTGQPS